MCVFLADVTDSDNVVYINEMLVKEGHAQWDLEVIGDNCYDVDRAQRVLTDWKLAIRRKMALIRKSRS